MQLVVLEEPLIA